MEILPPPVSTDHDMALASPTVIVGQGYGPQVNHDLVEAPVEGFSRDDPLLPGLEDEMAKEVAIGGSWSTTKRRIAWLDSPTTY